MTKSELIDAVKRWQVAVAITFHEENYQWLYNERFDPFRDYCDLYWLDGINTACQTFLALLEQLEEDDFDFCDESFEHWVERSTGMTDCFIGDPNGSQTATEATIFLKDYAPVSTIEDPKSDLCLDLPFPVTLFL